MSYQSFDFNGNQDFQQYLSSLFPRPVGEQVEKFKRKWYKRFIDPNFDLSTEDKSQQEEQKNSSPPPRQEEPKQQAPRQEKPQQEQTRQQPEQQQQQPQTQALPAKYIIENIFKCMYFPALGLVFMSGFGSYLNLTAMIVCVMALVRMSGKPQFNKVYLAKIIPNEFAGNLMYLLSMFLARGTLVYQMPLALHFMIGACEFWTRLKGNQMHPKLLQLTKYVKQNRNVILLIKQKIEVYLLVYSLIGIFLGISQITQVILLFQMVALKNKINPYMQQAQRELKFSYEKTFSLNPSLPAPLKSYDKAINIF